MPKQELKYHIFGYDKDADAYELVCACPTIIRACEVASDIVKSRDGEMLRFDTGEPFDWLVVARSGDPYDLHKIFSAEHPDGFQPL